MRTPQIFHFLSSVALLLAIFVPAQSSFAPYMGCDEDYSFGVASGSGDCYAVDSYLCRFKFAGGCEQVTGSYLYYNGGERADGSITFEPTLYRSVIIGASNSLCGGGTSSECSVSVGGQTCNSCQINDNGNWKEITLTNCNNIPGVFAATPQTIRLESGGGYIPLAADESRCQHPAIANRVLLPLQGELVYTLEETTTSPTNAIAAALVDNTVDYYTLLLKTSIPLTQSFDMNQWSTTFAGRGTTGSFSLQFNATLVLDPSATTTANTVDQQVAPLMTNSTLLNGVYLTQYVRLADPFFLATTTVAAMVQERS